MSSSPLTLIFDIYNGDEHLGKKEFSQQAIAMGSGKNAALRIENDSLNAFEVVFNVANGEVKMSDLVGQTRPLLLNGSPVRSNAVINNGDVISIGEVKLSVSFSEANAEDITQPAFANSTLADDATDPTIQVHDAPAVEKTQTLPAASKPSAPTNTIEFASEDILTEPKQDEQTPLEFLNSYSDKSDSKGKKQVLEVAQIFGKDIIDVKHFSKSSTPVTIGNDTRYCFRFASQPIAWVPKGIAKIAWLMYPFTESQEEWKTDFFVPSEGTYPLFNVKQADPVCAVRKEWTGFVEIGDLKHSFDELVAANGAEQNEKGYLIPVTDDTKIIIDTGEIQFRAQKVASSEKIPAGFGKMDWAFVAVLLLFGMVFSTFTVMMARSEPITLSTVDDAERFADAMLDVDPPEEEEVIEDMLIEEEVEEENDDAGEGEKHKDEEGKIGKEEAVVKEAKGDVVEIDQKQKDQEEADEALGMFKDALGNPGEDGLAVGAMAGDINIGGLTGAKGTQQGYGGFGQMGYGSGGGGTGDGIGMGDKGKGRGKYGTGQGGGSLGKKKKGRIGAIGGRPIVIGSLDKSLIQKVINQNISQIKYCYSRELTKNPNLSGTIKINFVIAKDGTVSKAKVKKSTMGNKKVESCIAGRFKRFKFPKPKGGGIVIVTYPFTFSS
jgi:hypothetical protein